MEYQEVHKSISQMRSMFAFFGGLNLFYIVYSVVGGSASICLTVPLGLAGLYLLAFWELGKKSKTGHMLAQMASVFFLLGFPLLTLFGISYLRKLSKPEMKEILSN